MIRWILRVALYLITCLRQSVWISFLVISHNSSNCIKIMENRFEIPFSIAQCREIGFFFLKIIMFIHGARFQSLYYFAAYVINTESFGIIVDKLYVMSEECFFFFWEISSINCTQPRALGLVFFTRVLFT